MEIKVLQADLAQALSTVSRAINSSNTLPILGNVLLEAFGDNLKISGTNLEVAICANCQVDVLMEGSITVPAKLLSSYVNLLPNTDVLIKADEDLNVSLITSQSKSQIKGLKSEDYPSIPEITGDVSLSLPASSLFNTKLSTPLVVAPMGHLTQFHKDGEAELALGAQKSSTFITISALSRLSLKEIRNKAKSAKIVPLCGVEIVRTL